MRDGSRAPEHGRAEGRRRARREGRASRARMDRVHPVTGPSPPVTGRGSVIDGCAEVRADPGVPANEGGTHGSMSACVVTDGRLRTPMNA